MRRILFCLAVATLLASPAGAAKAPRAAARAKPEAPKQEEKMVTAKGTTYIEMGGSEVNGQPNKSGSVYLLDRGDLPLRSMVRQRSSFRDQIVRDVLAP